MIRMIAFTCYFKHDTAYYSVKSGNIEEARRVLSHIYKTDIEQHLQLLIRDNEISAT